VGGLLALVLLAVHVFILPMVAAALIRRGLQASGFPEAGFALRGVSWNGLQLAALRADDSGDLAVAAVHVDWGIGDLLAGRVRTVEVTGARWEIGIADGHVDLGALGRRRPAARPAGDPAAPRRLPFDRLILRASELTIREAGSVHRVSFAGSAVTTPEGGVRAEVDAFAFGEHVRISGELRRGAGAGLAGVARASAGGPASVRHVGALRAHGAHAVLDLAFEVAADEITVRNAGASRLGADSVAWDAGGNGSSVGPVELVLSPATALRVRGAAGARTFQVDGELFAPAPLAIVASGTEGGLEGTIDQLAIAFRAAAPGPDPATRPSGTRPAGAPADGLVTSAVARIAAARLVHPRLGLALADVRLDCPLPLPASGTAEGRLRVGAVTLHDERLAGIDAQILQRGASLELRAGWSPTADTPLRLAGLEASGKVTVAASMSAQGGASPRLELTAEELAVTSAGGKTSIDGLDATITFAGFSPVRTPGGQRVAWSTARLAQVELTAGSIEFCLEGPDSILVERGSVGLGDGGRLWTQAFRVDPASPDVELQLFCEAVSLRQWLSIATVDRATGEGRLDGRLALRLRTDPRLTIGFGDGFLHAAAPGTFQVSDASLVRDALQKNLPAVSAGGPGGVDYNQLVQQRVVESLQDFAFEALTFDMIPRGDDLTLRVHTKGKGRRTPQELDLTVNFNGFDDFIDLAIGMKLGIDEAKREALEEIFPGTQTKKGGKQ
jgi:hypothetical protein